MRYTGKELTISLACDDPTKCKYEIVNAFTIAIYSLAFAEDNIKLDGVAGEFSTEIFNHIDCKQNVQTTVSAIPGQ